MPHNDSTEFPEQRLTKELTRISAALQRGDQPNHSLVELFEMLIHYGREMDVDPREWNDRVARHSESSDISLDNHRRSILMTMLRDIQTRLQSRALNLAERIRAHDAVRQANASYGGVVHGEHASQRPPAFCHQS